MDRRLGRQGDRKRRAFAERRVEIDPSAMLGDQLTAHEKTKPGSMFLRREIGLEQVRPLFFRDSRAVVADGYDNLAINDRPVNLNDASFGCCIDRIENQIENDLHHLIAYAVEHRKIVRHVSPNGSALGSFIILGDVQCFIHDLRVVKRVGSNTSGLLKFTNSRRIV